jgi:lysozyme
MDAISLIEKNEAQRLRCYDDANGRLVVPGHTMVGHPTIGYGRALDVDGVTPDEAHQFVVNEIPARLADLRVIFGAKWDTFGEARQAVLFDMHYTLGGGGLREFHIAITALLNQKWDAAADAIADSKWAKIEAVDRALFDIEVIRTGVFP